MCSEPVTRTPASGLSAAYFLRMAIRPGISYSATEISLRPQSASDRSATLYSVAIRFSVAVAMKNLGGDRHIDRSGYVDILEIIGHDVNCQIAPGPLRSKPYPDPAPARPGGTL